MRRSIALRHWGMVLAAAIVCTAVHRSLAGARAPAPAARADAADIRWRAPAALWLEPDGRRLFVAGSKSGTISVIDTAAAAIECEYRLGRQLVALDGTPDAKTLVACDSGSNELLILNRDAASVSVRHRVPLPATPTSIVMHPDGGDCFVSSRWSRVVSRVELASGQVSSSIALNFSPHRGIFLPDRRTLLVGDAFGGRLALIDSATGAVTREVEIPGHNLRGLALSPDGRDVLITHMIVTESAPLTRDNLFWGIAMTSNMRVIPIAALRDQKKNPVREAHTHFFGDPGNGAGDPESIEVLSDGTAVVCFAGIGEVAIGRYFPYGLRRVAVGRRPTALAVSPDERSVYVANTDADSVSVIDVEQRSVRHTIALGAEPKLTVAEEGEQAFFDARLTLDGWFSCHSCHTDGHTNGYRADTFGDGSYGAPKAVLSLLGTGSTEPWAWNGSKGFLENQVRDSLRQTMQPKHPVSERTVASITAYLRTLDLPPVADWQRRDAAAIARGESIFRSRGCTSCHVPPIYSNLHVYDVGLDDGEGGNRVFNPPSLHGVAHSAPYFHDGRAKDLEDVFRKYQHRLRTALTDEELGDLTAFLRSL